MAGIRRGRGERWLQAIAAAAIALALRALGATWRLRFQGADPFARAEPALGALWHRGLLVGAIAWRGRRIAVPVSLSRDGDLAARVLARLGFAASPRGSSSAGGSAVLRSLIRVVASGTPVAMLPDGPRGPAGRVKAGVLALAAHTGARIVPVGVCARPALHYASWDGAYLPAPFARVVCHYGEPLRVPKESDAEQLAAAGRQLEAALNAADAAAAAALAGGSASPASDTLRREGRAP